MKNKLIPAILAATAFMAGCNKDLIKSPEQYTKIYMPQAAESPAIRVLAMEDTLQPLLFGAAYGGVEDNNQALNVRFGVNMALVDSFNKWNNTSYIPMPAGSWQLDATEAQIPAGKLSSNALQIRIRTVGSLPVKTSFMLPVTLQQVSPALPVNEKLKTTYFLFQPITATLSAPNGR